MNKTIIILISTFLLAGCNRLDIHQPITSSTSSLIEGGSISQSFLSHANNLNIVSICIRNPDRIVIPMRFSISSGEKELRSIDFSSGNINEEDCTRFQFSPIENSSGKDYVSTIQTFPKPPEKLLPDQLIIEKDGSDLHYKTFYYQPIKDVVNESLAQIPPRFIADWGFFLAYGIILLLILSKLYKH